MKDWKLRIYKWNDGAKAYYIEDYCKSIKLSNSFKQISAELSFEIPKPSLSPALPNIEIEVGYCVSLTIGDTQYFAGKVIDINTKGKDETLTVNCYDYTWWLCKSNITKNFSDITVKHALEEVYKYCGAVYDIDSELGKNGDIMIKSHLVKNKQISKVLYAIYSEVTKVTGKYYYLHTQGDGSTMTITEADKYYSGMTIQPPTNLISANGNLIDYETNESMQNMVTSIEFFKSTGETYDESKNKKLSTEDIWRYGRIIENIQVDDDDTNAAKALEEARKKMLEQGKPSEELIVTCYGSVMYQVAHGVMVKIPSTKYYDIFMYITASEWILNNDGSFIAKLTLSTSKNQNLEDWTNVEDKKESKKNADGTEASSDLVNRIITELKSHLGLPYVWGGKSPSDGGMDCSGYISYCYNQFASELEISSGDGKLTSYTVTMMGEGKDVTGDFPDNLKPCDIIFPHSQHVVAYLGNKQVIHEPKTGDVCKISDIWFDSPAKVIRVVPDSAWKTSNSSGSGETAGNGKYSSKLVEFTKSWEGYRDTVYDDGGGTATIGYGTTAAANAGAIAKGNCSEEEATGWLQDEMNNIADQVQKACDNKGVALNQSWFDCLCDLSYQWGWPTIVTNDKKGIFSSLCNGDKDSAKSAIKNLGYGRRDNARCDMLDGNYTLND